MNTVSSISRITERGQITLPKRIRDSHPFSDARAVSISEKNGVITITPIKNTPDEQISILNAALHDWSDPAHDDLFDFSA
jgi:bifunctional DNA-binding transcriptional regulator/antitoxin component of YhaV-PrlF toxin-antitoxin module